MLTYIFDLSFSSNWSLIGNHWMNAQVNAEELLGCSLFIEYLCLSVCVCLCT